MNKNISELNTLFSSDLNNKLYTLRPRQNGRHFVDDIFKLIFSHEICCILIHISLKFILTGPISEKPTLVQMLPVHQKAIIWTNDGAVYWCFSASLGLNELIQLESLRIKLDLD